MIATANPSGRSGEWKYRLSPIQGGGGGRAKDFGFPILDLRLNGRRTRPAFALTGYGGQASGAETPKN